MIGKLDMRLAAGRAMGALRFHASCGVVHIPVRVLPDLSVQVKFRSFAVKAWRFSLAGGYTAKPVIPEAFRPLCDECGRTFGSARALVRHGDDHHSQSRG